MRAVGVETDDQGVMPRPSRSNSPAARPPANWSGSRRSTWSRLLRQPPLTIPLERRAAPGRNRRRWSRRHRIYLIEDAAYRELRYAADDVPSLRSFDPEGDTVLYAGTFSKSYSPGIRVGWGVLPKGLAGAVLAEKGNIDFGSPHLNQVLMATVIEMGLFDRHVERLRAGYRRKIEAILAASEEFLRPIAGVE